MCCCFIYPMPSIYGFYFYLYSIYILVYVYGELVGTYTIVPLMVWVSFVPTFPQTEALHHLEKPQFPVAPPPEEHEEDEEMEEAKAEPPKLWLTQQFCWNVESQHIFLFGGGEIFVYIISGDVVYIFCKNMYTMYRKFLNHWNIFGNTFPHFSGWWFQTFVIIVIFIPKLVEDEPILASMFFKWVGSATNQFYVSPRSFKIMIQQIWSHEWGSQPLKFPQCQLQYHWGQKNTPEDYRLEHNSLDGWQIIFLSKWVICRLFDVICRWSNRSSSRVYLILFL